MQYFTAASLRAQLESAGFRVQEVFPIMTGEFARKAFQKRIESGGFGHRLPSRIRFYRRLRGDDRHSQSPEGIMLVARASRPEARETAGSSDR